MTWTTQSILIVEHDEPTRELYRRALSHDYHVLATCEIATALDLLGSQRIAAIVLEPAGPRGWDLLAEVQRMTGGARVPIILCSTQDERRRGMQLGASAYLVKPVLPHKLAEAVRRVIGQPR